MNLREHNNGRGVSAQAKTSALIISEPPLQVLPSLAIKIGLNEAIVLQQLWYLLRNPAFGRQIAEHKWIFNTYEQWVAEYFPFWSVVTVKRTFANLAKMNLIASCQPEGRLSRRKYYRVNIDALEAIPERIKLTPSNGSNWNVPLTKTTEAKITLSKETKETSFASRADASVVSSEIPATWIPDERTKAQKLASVRPPRNYPTEREFDEFLETEQLDEIMSKRCDTYHLLCVNKWHHWTGRKWIRVRDWKAYVAALDVKMTDAF